MKIKTEDRILAAIKRLSGRATTQNIADELNLSRSLTSNYLNQLASESKVYKNGTKPIFWFLLDDKESNKDVIINEIKRMEIVHYDVFDKYIGSKGSQRNIIKQCKAAVKYPPLGIPILLIGESGTGKSYLASLIYEYSIQEGILKKGSPFKLLNCADYANNPELLSSALFGYKKGSFTGAEQNQTGLLDAADGGILFLDEVHRLSRENQEKLFVFMDKGKFLRLGDGKEWTESKVRLIFATTENISDVLLETFRRRIGVKLYLQNLRSQPLIEKVQLVEELYYNEAKRLNKDLIIASEVVELLISGKIEGNIGGIKNLIRMSCANSMLKGDDGELEIKMSDMPEEYQQVSIHDLNIDSMIIKLGVEDMNNKAISYYVKIEDELIELIKRIMCEDKSTYLMDILIFYRRIMKTIKGRIGGGLILNQDSDNYFIKRLSRELEEILNRYGISKYEEIVDEIINIVFLFQYNKFKEEVYIDIEKSSSKINSMFPRTNYIYNQIKKLLDSYKIKNDILLNILLILTLQERVNENIKLGGLLIAHGNSTATSIQEVVNRLHGTFVFEGIDMPISSSVKEIIEKVKAFLDNYDTTYGLILLIDMGSLSQLYTPIKDFIKGDLLIIDNLSTAMALDVGMKMIDNCAFEEISKEAEHRYRINTQYFEGLSNEANIIISCLSGIGISERLKEIISEHVPKEVLTILTIEYTKIQDLVAKEDQKYFNKTKLIITTNDIDELFGVPVLNIYDALRKEGEDILWRTLSSFVSEEQFQNMMKDIVKSFSIEGVENRLKILNPKIVIAESEFIIESYESYYNIELKGYKKLNLFMHISLMIERLVSDKEFKDIPLDEELDEKKEEFFNISKAIFSHTEQKFNIHVPAQEVILLYEIFKHLL